MRPRPSLQAIKSTGLRSFLSQTAIREVPQVQPEERLGSQRPDGHVIAPYLAILPAVPAPSNRDNYGNPERLHFRQPFLQQHNAAGIPGPQAAHALPGRDCLQVSGRLF